MIDFGLFVKLLFYFDFRNVGGVLLGGAEAEDLIVIWKIILIQEGKFSNLTNL